MEKISKNIYKGERITDLRELNRLTDERKSVVAKMAGRYFIRPAAFMSQWSVERFRFTEIYYSVKINDSKSSK